MPMPDWSRCRCCRRGSYGPFYRVTYDDGPETLLCADCARHTDLTPDGQIVPFDRCPHATLRLLVPDAPR